MKCKICNNVNNNKIYEVKEMMFGLRDAFTYFQCSSCDCLQIADIPADMSKYYPKDYYSFNSSTGRVKNPVKRLFKNLRNGFSVFNTGFAGKFLHNFIPSENLPLLSKIPLTKNSAVLDVGCGSGTLLHDLKELGFKNVLGIDPYIEGDIEYANGLKILRKSILQLDKKFDLIMFHHSFEHIPDPLETLQSVSKLLNKDGTCLIRIPTASSHAWEHYKENWVQLDAPRHFFNHSVKSMELLAEKANLKMEKVVYDSTDFQFWGSEQYIRDIPLTDAKSYAVNTKKSIFSETEIAGFKQKAKELNQAGRGDSCGFFLRLN